MKELVVFPRVFGSAKQIFPKGKKAGFLYFKESGAFTSILECEKKKSRILSQNDSQRHLNIDVLLPQQSQDTLVSSCLS